MSDQPTRPGIFASSLDARLALGASALSWLVSAWRIGPSISWVQDYATLVAVIPGIVGYEGLVSAALAVPLRCLPFGSVGLRVALVNAVGAALVAWCTYALAHWALRTRSRHQRLHAGLALASALLVALGPSVQGFSAGAGACNVAAALGLGSLLSMVRATEDEPPASAPPQSRDQAFFLVGLSVAITWLESHWVGLLTLTVAVTLGVSTRAHRRRRQAVMTLVGFSTIALCVGAPCALARRTLAAASVERSFWDSLALLRPFTGYVARLGIWLGEFGPLWTSLAIAGLVVLLLQAEWRRVGWLFAALVVTSLLLPSTDAGSNCDRAPVVIGACLLSISAALGCLTGLSWLARKRPSAFALGSSLLMVACAVTILAKNEQITFSQNRYRSLGGEAWTDEALVSLPAHSLVLTRTRAITNRLIAAQLVEGMRPDVLVVPLQRMTEARVATALQALEPATTPVLRDLAINGKPSENALTSLADARPLYLEFDANWDPRLRDHLLVQPIFQRVFSQTLGRSDRSAVLGDGQRAVARILAATETNASTQSIATSPDLGNAITRELVDFRLREQLTLLLALGDRLAFDTLARDYEHAFPNSEWMGRLRRRLGSSSRGALVAFDLLSIQPPRWSSML